MIIGIAHSKPIFAIGLRTCLDGMPDTTIITADADISDVFKSIDVLLLDGDLAGNRPSWDGLRKAARRSPVLVLVPDDLDPGCRTDFLDAGAAGCIDCLARPGDIVDQVRAVSMHVGEAAPKVEPGIDALSPREITALSYIARGFTHEQTARRMAISRHTVDTYIKRARAKLHLGNKAELTRAVLSGTVWPGVS